MENLNLLKEIKELNRYIGISLVNQDSFSKKTKLPSTTQMMIVKYILNNKDKDIFQKDLERNLNTTRATLSGVLKTMEKNNIIKRITNKNDARSKKIILNDNVLESFNKCNERMSVIEKVLVNNISNDDLKTFIKVLNKMKENIIDERMIIND